MQLKTYKHLEPLKLVAKQSFKQPVISGRNTVINHKADERSFQHLKPIYSFPFVTKQEHLPSELLQEVYQTVITKDSKGSNQSVWMISVPENTR